MNGTPERVHGAAGGSAAAAAQAVPGWRRSLRAGACALLVAACGAADNTVEEPVPMPDPTPIEYPVALWDQKVQGETELMIHVTERGDVDSVFVSKTSGWQEFDSAAVSGARQLRFTPGRRGERRVAMWTKMPVRFAQDSTATDTATATLGESRAPGTDR
jgi:TonB family protein